MTERMVDHLIDHEITWGMVDDPQDPEKGVWRGRTVGPFGRRVDPREDEDFNIFLGRDTWDGEEHFLFRGYVPQGGCPDFAVPAVWITRMDGFGGALYCTAWQVGVDPRGSLDDMVHVDPEQVEGVDVCPVHEL